MPKNPFEALLEISKNKIESDKKRNEFIHTQADSLITWLVGFAFTALCLIVANISSIKTNLKSTAKPIVICFFITIVIGLIFRYISYLTILFQKDLEDHYLQGAYGDLEMTPIKPEEEIEDSSFDDIIRALKSDFNEDIPYGRELSENEKAKELPNLIAHYIALCEHSKKQFDIGVRHIAEVNEKAYRIDKKITIERFSKELDKSTVGYHLVRWEYSRWLLYSICLLSFIIGVSIACVYFLCQ
jgi:hypothetical protein